jgi:hypothetical protein
MRLRLLTILGLEYTSGDVQPVLPELAPNQAVSFRWKLVPLEDRGALIASLALERSPNATPPPANTPLPKGMEEPQLAFTTLPRFAMDPASLAPKGKLSPLPRAKDFGSYAMAGNDRVQVCVLQSATQQPSLALYGRAGESWTQLAFAPNLLEAVSAEEGQRAWGEAFRVTSVTARADKDLASLKVQGTIGKRWIGEIYLEVLRDSSAVQGKARLYARRPIKLYRLQLPRLLSLAEVLPPLKADGSAQLVESDTSPLSDVTALAARLVRGIVYGLAWSATPPLTDWKAERLSICDPQRTPMLGAMWMAPLGGEAFTATRSMEIPFRLFALGESQTVRDANNFALP